jgi:hypothetical protein
MYVGPESTPQSSYREAAATAESKRSAARGGWEAEG